MEESVSLWKDAIGFLLIVDDNVFGGPIAYLA